MPISDKRQLQHLFRNEILRIVLFVVLGYTVGLLFGYAYIGLFVAVIVLFSRYLFVVFALSRWLFSGREPNCSAEHMVYTIIHRIRSSNNQLQLRKNQVSTLARGFRDLVRALPDAIVVIDKNMRIEWFNDRANMLLPLEKGDYGNSITSLVRKPGFVQFLHTDDYTSTPVLRIHSGDLRYLRVHRINYTRQSDLLVFRDVTRIHELQKQQASFIANASHELNTPLTVIRGYTELAQKNISSDSKSNEFLQKSIAEIDRLSTLTKDLMTLSHLNENRPEKYNITLFPAQIIRNVVQKMSIIPEYKNREIILKVNEKLTIKGVEGELETIFNNLIDNALKYSPESSKVTVSWDANTAGTAVFTVIDKGIGIEKKLIPRVTEQFYRIPANGHPDPGGTGLGLSIVNTILERYSGELKIESVVGEGSCFRCLFA